MVALPSFVFCIKAQKKMIKEAKGKDASEVPIVK